MCAAARTRLVHRDIKPQNIMLTRSGAKLLDFNIASRVGDPVRTQSGTPPYQPPDADLTRWDVSTDLFAVGVTLYELLCDGQHPYPNSRPIAGDPVIDPSTIRTGLDPQITQFLVKACASLEREPLRDGARDEGRARLPAPKLAIARHRATTGATEGTGRRFADSRPGRAFTTRTLTGRGYVVTADRR